MTEEIQLGVYERLLNDYESDKEKHAADLAYAACGLGDTVTSEEIARNEKAITLEVGLPLALSGIDKEIWKGYLSKPVNGPEKLREYFEGISRWHRQNVDEDSDDPVKVDYGSLVESIKYLEDDWYSKFFEWVRFCEIDAVFEDDDIEKCKCDTEKWGKAIPQLWSGAKPDHLKILLCLETLFKGNSSLNLEKPSKKPAYPWYLSYNLAKEIVEDSIKSFASERNLNTFILYMLGISINETDLGMLYYEHILKICANVGLSRASLSLGNLQKNDELYLEAFKWYEKGAKLGCPYTQGALANLYEGNEGVLQDLSKARDWRLKALAGLERLGNKGDFIAMTVIAGYYANGAEGIPINRSEALKWYKRALPIADKRDYAESRQEILIGIYEIYSNNQEWKDIKKLESEAQSGDTSASAAMQAIGDLYLNGDTVPQNLNEARKWYKKAAEHIEKPFFVLAIKGYENYMQDSEYCKVDKAFRRIVEKALDKKIVHTEEFLACYRFMPGGKDAKEAIKRVRDCFYKHDPKFVEEIEELIGTELSCHWGEWPIGVKREIREYLEELFLVTLEKPPKDLAEFIKNKGGKLKGFGLAQLSQQCVLLRPDFYLVMNNATSLAESVKKDKKLSDNNYTNYPLLCEKIVNDLGPLGFSSTYLGHVFDRLVCKWAEGNDEILSKNLVENFQILVNRLLGIVEKNSTISREVKTKLRIPSDPELRELLKKFKMAAEQHYSGEPTIKALADKFKLFLEGCGYCYEPEYENKLREYLKNE